MASDDVIRQSRKRTQQVSNGSGAPSDRTTVAGEDERFAGGDRDVGVLLAMPDVGRQPSGDAKSGHHLA